MNISRRNFIKTTIAAAAGITISPHKMVAVPNFPAVKMLADYEHQNGKLRIANYVYNGEFTNTPHYTVHYAGAIEGKDSFDSRYSNPPDFTKNTKVVSIIFDNEVKYELKNDARPVESITPVNLEISLHSQDGSDIVMNDTRNELQIKFPVADWKFGRKPICLYRRHFLGEGALDLEFLADIREATAKSPGEILILPLPNLNGVYGSQVPYDFFQVRFEFPGDFNMDGKQNLKDMAYMEGWKQPEAGSLADITGPNGVPDKIFDEYDLGAWTDDYLKDINDPNTWEF